MHHDPCPLSDAGYILNSQPFISIGTFLSRSSCSLLELSFNVTHFSKASEQALIAMLADMENLEKLELNCKWGGKFEPVFYHLNPARTQHTPRYLPPGHVVYPNFAAFVASKLTQAPCVGSITVSTSSTIPHIRFPTYLPFTLQFCKQNLGSPIGIIVSSMKPPTNRKNEGYVNPSHPATKVKPSAFPNFRSDAF